VQALLRDPESTTESTRSRERTCVVCRRADREENLVRWVVADDGTFGVDLAQKSAGRGHYLHPVAACLRQAHKALTRVTQGVARMSSADLLEVLEAQAARRLQGLLLAARRSRLLCLGVEACGEAARTERLRHLLLAHDAGKHVHGPWLETLMGRGDVSGCLSRTELGEMLGREELTAVGVSDEGLACALGRAARILTVSRILLAERRNVERSEAG